MIVTFIDRHDCFVAIERNCWIGKNLSKKHFIRRRKEKRKEVYGLNISQRLENIFTSTVTSSISCCNWFANWRTGGFAGWFLAELSPLAPAGAEPAEGKPLAPGAFSIPIVVVRVVETLLTSAKHKHPFDQPPDLFYLIRQTDRQKERQKDRQTDRSTNWLTA